MPPASPSLKRAESAASMLEMRRNLLGQGSLQAGGWVAVVRNFGRKMPPCATRASLSHRSSGYRSTCAVV
jgi:hypothetical protein